MQAAIPAQGIADDNRTLKIFMAPEFYFRGKNGAYTPDIVSAIIPHMRTLGTGGAGFSKPVCLDTMFRYLARTLLQGVTPVQDVRIVIFPQST